jgi:hypothetical protein
MYWVSLVSILPENFTYFSIECYYLDSKTLYIYSLGG